MPKWEKELNKLSETEASMISLLYNRWKEEIFYRRNRTTFITTWTSTLFIAIIGGKLAGNKVFGNNELILATSLIVIIWLVAMYYFSHNVKMHGKAKKILINLERKFLIDNETLFDLSYGGKPQSKKKVLEKNFSEIGSVVQALFVTLVSVLSVIVLWLGEACGETINSV